MKHPPGYEEEFNNTIGIYVRRKDALYEEREKNGIPDDEYFKLWLAIGDEMLEKLHHIRAKYDVPDPVSENEK